jgi:hypothetical protein
MKLALFLAQTRLTLESLTPLALTASGDSVPLFWRWDAEPSSHLLEKHPRPLATRTP